MFLTSEKASPIFYQYARLRLDANFLIRGEKAFQTHNRALSRSLSTNHPMSYLGSVDFNDDFRGFRGWRLTHIISQLPLTWPFILEDEQSSVRNRKYKLLTSNR